MGDSDLEAIRAQRLAQLQNSGGGGSGGPQFPGGAEDAGNKQKEMEERQSQQEEAKNQMLSQILDQPARARLNTLMVAKPEKGHMVENMLINMARSGQIRGKLGESDLVGILEKVNEKTNKTTKVKFDRRRTNLDDDDEDFDL